MAESTLATFRDELRAEIGHYLGYGRGVVYSEPAWTTAQANNIDSVLKSGSQQFYTPPPLNDREAPHSWSFLRPFTTITLTAGAATATLPDDFGYFEGPLYITTAGTAYRSIPVQIVNEGMVAAKHAAMPDTRGAPRYAAASPISGTTAAEGTRYNLYVWPKPDQAYVLNAEYKHLPDVLTSLLPYPPGGMEHAATIKAAVLAAAELELDDVRGERWQQFMQRLAASVAVDGRKKGMKIGYNADRSDSRYNGRTRRDIDNPPVTYNGDPL